MLPGTFALDAAGIVSVLVTCRYCAPTSLRSRTGEPVVVIVRRYEALANESPTASDLENLPYAHVESALALRPFTLLAQSTGPYPGSRLSDRGTLSERSLLWTTGRQTTTSSTAARRTICMPAQFERDANVGSASNAYLYGDQAGGGTVTLEPYGDGSNWQVATLGSDVIGRAQIGSQAARAGRRLVQQ